MSLRRVRPEAVAAQSWAIDGKTLAEAGTIVEAVRQGGEASLRRYAESFGDVLPGRPMVIGQAELEAALHGLPAEDRGVLERTAQRIEAFARAQLVTLSDLNTSIPGGRAGHRVMPLRTAGCYAPGGRFPLPSSVLMTAITARVAGVETVWVASPKPRPITLAAAALAGVDGFLAVGGAQGISAMAHGICTPVCDIIVGPGNRWVTAAKQLVSGRCRIDMLAGPSELLVLADDTAEPGLIAADLLAQAEHDPDAVPMLVCTSEALAAAVDEALSAQLATLPTAETARAALENGFTVVVESLEAALPICDQLAPEHLQIITADADGIAERLQRYGALFVGPRSAEVLGDYGAGPNHVLPTGGTGRFSGGLSVLNFLCVRTWMKLDAPGPLAEDAARLARLEGLEGHARAADRRRG